MDRQLRITELIALISKKTVRIATDENLFDAGLIDSFALTDLVVLLEKEFGFKVPDDAAESILFDFARRLRLLARAARAQQDDGEQTTARPGPHRARSS